jgi:site-specific DNA-cytosine methylase
MIDTFSGIGGFSLAARWLGGIETVQFVERDPYCQRILAKHWPTVPIHDDICTFNPAPGSADIVCGGFFCQDISTAGKQAGIKEGTRSGLFYELMRVVRLVGPRYIVLENVAAITSNGMDAVLGTLAEAGFDAEWACIPASAVGACHRRDRWWLVAYASGADRGRWPEGTGRGQWSPADAGGCRVPKMRGGADCNAHWPKQNTEPAYAKGQQCNDRGSADPVGPAKAAAELGNGDGKDAAGLDILAATIECRYDFAADADSKGPQGQAIPRVQRERLWNTSSRRLNPDWRSYLSEPVLRRGDDGLSGRVDRLKALGNAVVPQVAMIPLSRVLADYQ